MVREDGYDVSDWLDDGHTLAELQALVEQAPVYSPDEASAQANGIAPTALSDYRVAEAPLTFPRTDAGNAELFAYLYGDRVRYDHRQKRWLLWDKHHWKPDPDQQVWRLAKEGARWRYGEASGITDLDERGKEAAWAIGSEQRPRLASALSLAQAERPIADTGVGWDADPWLLGVPNGVVDLRTGEHREGRQQDRITMQAGVAYDLDAKCPRWLQFLDEVFGGDKELIDWIHRALGYSVTGSTKEQISFFCHGRGDNGKTTLIRAVRGVLGDYGATTPFSTLEESARTGIPNDLAALAGRRLVTASEMNEGKRLNEARLKMLAGEDIVSARFLNQEFFEFKPAMKFWLAVNHKPKVEDDSRGLWRKIRLVPFLQNFSNQGDKNLEEKLLAESAGILTWLVQGALAWQERGLEPAKAVAVATEAYRLESDKLAEFIEESCITGDECSAQASVIYKRYKVWADEDQGLLRHEILSHKKFGTMMGERYNKKRHNKGNVYIGIGLRDVNARSPDQGGEAGGDESPDRVEGDTRLSPSLPELQREPVDDGAEQVARDLCYNLAEGLNFPALEIRKGHRLAASELAWNRLVSQGHSADVEAALAALDRLGEEQQGD